MSLRVTWQKSTFSGGGDGNNCLELAVDGDAIRLRESDRPDTVLTTTPAALGQFLRAVRRGVPHRG